MIKAKNSNNEYVNIEDIKAENVFEDTSPLIFKGKWDKVEDNKLKNYRIYGNTVNGESVGDRTGNLFDEELAQGYYADTVGSSNNLISSSMRVADITFVPVTSGETVTLSYISEVNETKWLLYKYNSNKELISVGGWYVNGATITIPDNVTFIRFCLGAKNDWSFGNYLNLYVSDISNIMLNTSSEPLPYEPYGYRVPVTVRGKNLFDENYLINVKKSGCTLSVSNHIITFSSTGVDAYFGEVITEGTLDKEYRTNYGQKIPCLEEQTYYITISDNRINKNYVTFIDENGVRVSGKKFTTSSFSFTIPSGAKYMFFRIGKENSVAGDVFQFTVLVTKLPTSTYEPYYEPTINNLYLPEPLRKIEDNSDYIDFKTQKLYKIDGTELDIEIPELQTINGTNILSIDTEILPSNIWGKIEETKDIEYVKDNLGNVLYSKYNEIETEILPINFISKNNTLKNYRIYGNTVNGESVGDRTENLFDEIYTEITVSLVTHYRELRVPNGQYTLSTSTPLAGMANLFLCTTEDPTPNTANNGVYKDRPKTVTVNDERLFIFYRALNADPRDYQTMLNLGSTALPYEPYGYKVPVTVNEQTTNIYLNAPLAKSGNNADYIDFKTQKRYNSDGTESIVTLPEIAVTTGTNTLTIGTEVQPSKVYLKGKITEINY